MYRILKLFLFSFLGLSVFFINPSIAQDENTSIKQNEYDAFDNKQINNILLNGSPKDLRELLNQNINVNTDYGCHSMLNKAIQGLILSENDELKPEDTVEKVKILIEAGADVNKETCKMTPLAMTVTLLEQGRQMEKEFLAILNANINSSDGICNVNGVNKPCIETSSKERVQMRNELHETFSNELKKTEIFVVKILGILIENGANINKPSYMVAPLLFAANTPKNSGLMVLKFLLDNGADPNVKDFQGNTPLFVANFADNKDAIKLLINAGADTTIRNNKGELYNEYKTGQYYKYN